MRVVSFNEFQENMPNYLSRVNDGKEILIVRRTEGQSIVLIDLDEYNAIQKTLHAGSSKRDRERMEKAPDEIKKKGK